MIRIEDQDRIRIVTLDRAEKRNALTPEMIAMFERAINETPQSARALLVRGEGKVFCAGFDLKLCAQDESNQTMRDLLSGLSKSVRAMRALEQPVVLVAHGAAIAGGCALLGGADIVVCDERAQLGYPVAKIGVSPSVSAPFLMSSIPSGAARSLMLDPGLIDASRARQIGLVHEMTSNPDAAHERGEQIARSLASKPGVGVANTKDLCNALASSMTEHADRALDASLSRVGSDEERTMLAALWAPKESS